ncbi:MAG: ATPase domain-containing protein [Methanobacteriota archaeon]
MEIERIKTYIHGLDEHIEGGIPKGSISLICGTPGTMKSSLAYSILHSNAVKEGVKGLYITLEQEIKSLRQQMEKLKMREIEALTLVDFDMMQKKIERKPETNWIQRVGGFIESMGEGCELLVVDSLNALYSLTNIENPRREIYYLFKTLRETGMTCFLISEISLGKARFSHYGVEEFLADNIIHLEFKKRGDLLSSLERYIGIVKMRATNHDTQYFPILYLKDRFTAYGREELELE